MIYWKPVVFSFCVFLSFVLIINIIHFYEYPKVTEQVDVNGSLRYFTDLGELVEFVNTDLTNEVRYSKDYDCDNFCLDFQKHAFESGYIVNVQSITPDEYKRYFNVKISGFHMICSTIAGNSFYYIDVQNDEIKRVALID